MTDYRDEVCRSPIDGPTHPIIGLFQQQRAQRFSHQGPVVLAQNSSSARPAETVGDRVLSLERQVDDLKHRVNSLEARLKEALAKLEGQTP